SIIVETNTSYQTFTIGTPYGAGYIDMLMHTANRHYKLPYQGKIEIFTTYSLFIRSKLLFLGHDHEGYPGPKRAQSSIGLRSLWAWMVLFIRTSAPLVGAPVPHPTLPVSLSPLPVGRCRQSSQR